MNIHGASRWNRTISDIVFHVILDIAFTSLIIEYARCTGKFAFHLSAVQLNARLISGGTGPTSENNAIDTYLRMCVLERWAGILTLNKQGVSPCLD